MASTLQPSAITDQQSRSRSHHRSGHRHHHNQHHSHSRDRSRDQSEGPSRDRGRAEEDVSRDRSGRGERTTYAKVPTARVIAATTDEETEKEEILPSRVKERERERDRSRDPSRNREKEPRNAEPKYSEKSSRTQDRTVKSNEQDARPAEKPVRSRMWDLLDSGNGVVQSTLQTTSRRAIKPVRDETTDDSEPVSRAPRTTEKSPKPQDDQDKDMRASEKKSRTAEKSTRNKDNDMKNTDKDLQNVQSVSKSSRTKEAATTTIVGDDLAPKSVEKASRNRDKEARRVDSAEPQASEKVSRTRDKESRSRTREPRTTKSSTKVSSSVAKTNCAHCAELEQRNQDLESQVESLTLQSAQYLEQISTSEGEIRKLRGLQRSISSAPDLSTPAPPPIPADPQTAITDVQSATTTTSGIYSRLGGLTSFRMGRSVPKTPTSASQPSSSPLGAMGDSSVPQLPDQAALQAQLAQEKTLRVEAEKKASQLTNELEDLSQNLFEEANRMVSEEKKKRFEAEQQLQAMKKEMERRDRDKSRRLDGIERALERVSSARRMLNGQPP